ncbi:xanthine dehydrogenase family protein molybdopterin-binding subunit [Thermopolyspora sp. NPDC052614]|uniref:xanthine dehydrogenase family protein molybdopterin-binding subunit n=1 Tax=Thermopolyspora sp. NPDC052614 TaxID=3155682 RepID=UPI003423EE13
MTHGVPRSGSEGRGAVPGPWEPGPWEERWNEVTGRALFAAEHAPSPVLAYVVPVQSAIARGEVASVDCETPPTLPGMLAVLWHGNAPGLGTSDDPELNLFQSPEIAHRGQFVAAVVAETLETAYEAASRIEVEYVAKPHDVVLHAGHPRAYRPPDHEPGETGHGDVERALREAAVSVDLTYTSPAYHHNPMEPHATVAVWEDQGLTLYDTCPGASAVCEVLAGLFALPPKLVRVIAPQHAAGFGGECVVRPQTVLAAMAAKVTGRPVKAALTRRQMFAVTGYRTPIIQRVRLGADACGRLTAIAHHAVEQTSVLKDPGEPVMRMAPAMYLAPNRRVTREIVPLDVPTPSWLRAHGEFPGLFALESAMDELAIACGLDPIELRVRNQPEADAHGRVPRSFSLVACLREGAELFGWTGRDPTPGVRRDGRWLVGTGVAASTCPVWARPAEATALLEADGRYRVRIPAPGMRADERAALNKIAADALRVAPERVRIELRGGGPRASELGASEPRASEPGAGGPGAGGPGAGGPGAGGPGAGGPGGAVTWAPAVVRACEALVELLGQDEAHAGPFGAGPAAVPCATRGVGPPREATATLPAALPDALIEHAADPAGRYRRARHAYGAQFAEARVDVDTGEVRVPRLLGVFAAGRVADPEETRARFVAAMTMGLSMTLLEHSALDETFGDFLNDDLSRYLIATSADVGNIDVRWVGDDGLGTGSREPRQGRDQHREQGRDQGREQSTEQSMESVAEIGIVATAAAIANAVYHATGVRVRNLPIRLDRLVTRLPAMPHAGGTGGSGS